jgi:hypothetical protein
MGMFLCDSGVDAHSIVEAFIRNKRNFIYMLNRNFLLRYLNYDQQIFYPICFPY